MPRILTYNVHRCVGTDRRLDVGRIAAVIASAEPDIVALQEVDVRRARTGGVDQAHEIAERLKMAFRFNAAMRVEEELYGDALLTHYPEVLVRAGPLPHYTRIPGLEPRGALWIEADIDGRDLQVVNTHLGLIPREQHAQAAALAGHDWLGGAKAPTLLVGDFNATPISATHRRLSSVLTDARKRLPAAGRVPTFPSSLPVLAIDHVFVSAGVTVHSVRAHLTPLSRLASDHLPLVVDFELA